MKTLVRFAALLTFLVPCVVATPLTSSLNSTELQWSESALLSTPSLRLRVLLKGNNMQIHGQSVFDVFARPTISADGTGLHYDGFATFVQDDTEFTYMLVDGSTYVIETKGDNSTAAVSKMVRCFPCSIPFDSIVPALNNANAIPSASVGGEPVECPSGSLFQTSWGGLDMVLCASGASGFVAYGLDLTIAVEYLSKPIRNITAPTLSDKTTSCDVVATPASVTPTALALLTGSAIPVSASRKLKAIAPVAIETESCGCKSTPRPCIFLHGLGNPTEEAELQDTPELAKSKFGDMNDHAPCCTTVKYAVLNTIDYNWLDDTLQQKFCDFSLSMSETSDVTTGAIADTVVVTHSMGGLVMSMALATGKCKFTESTTWVSLSAPMAGSMASDFAQDMCNDEYGTITTNVLELTGNCPSSRARKSVPYLDGKYITPEVNAAYMMAQEAYRSHVGAAMCSNEYDGIYSEFRISLVLGGTIIPHKSSENDGLVEFQSCLGGLDPALFGDHYLDRFYKPRLNHADTAFLTHDGFFEDSQKPFKWFECLL